MPLLVVSHRENRRMIEFKQDDALYFSEEHLQELVDLVKGMTQDVNTFDS